jgi:bacteriorhodopsin
MVDSTKLLSLTCGVELADDAARYVYLVSLSLFGVMWLATAAVWMSNIALNDDGHGRCLASSDGMAHIGASGGRKNLSLALLLFTLQVGLYVALLLGQGSSYIAQHDLCVPWIRWAVYSVSCALLSYKVAIAAKLNKAADGGTFVGLISLTLISGVLSAASTGSENARWAWFGLGFVPYAPAMYLLVMKGSNPLLSIFIVLSWGLYPIIYLFGVAMIGGYSIQVESIFYLIADFFTKILFEVWIIAWMC